MFPVQKIAVSGVTGTYDPVAGSGLYSTYVTTDTSSNTKTVTVDGKIVAVFMGKYNVTGNDLYADYTQISGWIVGVGYFQAKGSNSWVTFNEYTNTTQVSYSMSGVGTTTKWTISNEGKTITLQRYSANENHPYRIIYMK